MAEQKIQRPKRGTYTTEGKKRQHRTTLAKRRVYRRASERGAPRLVDLAALVAWEGES